MWDGGLFAGASSWKAPVFGLVGRGGGGQRRGGRGGDVGKGDFIHYKKKILLIFSNISK